MDLLVLLSYLGRDSQIEVEHCLSQTVILAAVADHVRKLLHPCFRIAHSNAQSRGLQDLRIVHAVAEGDAVGGGFTQMAADFLQCRALADRKVRDLTCGQREVWHQVVETDDLRAALQCCRQVVCHGAVYAEKGNLVTTAIHIRGEKWKNLVSIFAPFNGNTELIAVREDGSVIGYWDRRKDWEVEFKQYGKVIYAVGETAYNDNTNVLCLRMDGTFAGNPSGGFMTSLNGVKLFNNPDTIQQEKVEKIKNEIETIEKTIEQKKEELANIKGLFSGGKKRALQSEIDQLGNKLAKLKAKIDE